MSQTKVTDSVRDTTAIDAAKLTGSIADARVPASAVTQHALLDSPVITGTLSVLDSGTVTHTIANWSDVLSYTITPTNCTVGAINASGQFVITHTSGSPSYTILATTASLGLADSALVTKNITITLTAPTLSSPADVGTATNVVYTITSTDSNDDKLILNMGSSNFTYQSVSVGTASKVGNTVECIGFTTNNPAVTIQFTAEATYSVTATAVKIDGTYGTSAASSADSITILNFTAMVATGGTITTVGNYKVHTFLSSGTFEVTTVGSLYTTLDYLVVAGGGPSGLGGTGSTAGGGAGGYRSSWNSETSGGGAASETGLTATATTYTVTVGAGGTVSNVNGGDSVFGSITSLGGGAGSKGAANYTGNVGGSGGGAESKYPSGIYTGAAGTAGQGYKGGDGATNTNAYLYNSGGGGGAAAAGTNAQNGGYAAPGGAGQYSTISGSSTAYAGGGGGWNYPTATQSAGGVGGGGIGGHTNTYWGTAGTANTGGGGGAGTNGQGGSGIVIIRYRFQQ